jgi:hypothetical protein
MHLLQTLAAVPLALQAHPHCATQIIDVTGDAAGYTRALPAAIAADSSDDVSVSVVAIDAAFAAWLNGLGFAASSFASLRVDACCAPRANAQRRQRV